jgi:hypothetical protein
LLHQQSQKHQKIKTSSSLNRTSQDWHTSYRLA